MTNGTTSTAPGTTTGVSPGATNGTYTHNGGVAPGGPGYGGAGSPSNNASGSK
jgi:hypothetical protein